MTPFQWRVIQALCRVVLASALLGKPVITFGDKSTLEDALRKPEQDA